MCSQTEHAKMFVKSVQNRRHVMATDETPSAEAVTRAYTTQETCQAARHTITGMCAHCVALALETFACELCDKGDQAWEKICREREAAVWNVLDVITRACEAGAY